MSDKTIQEIMWDVEQMLYSCETTGDMKKVVLQIALDNFPYEEDETIVINVKKLKEALMDRLKCKNNPDIRCSECIYKNECKFIYSMASLFELILAIEVVPSNLKIAVSPELEEDVIEQ